MIQEINAAIPNCQIIISDAGERALPEFSVALVRANGLAIVVSCIPWSEGEIGLVIGEDPEVDPGTPPAWSGRLATPSRLVRVETVEGEMLVEHVVSRTATHVRIWANDTLMPDQIVIGLS